MIRLNPMLKKELKLSVRTPRPSVLILCIVLFMSTIGMAITYMISTQFYWSGIFNYRNNIVLFILILFAEFLFIMFIVPILTSGVISGERERQTLDLLLASPMKPRQIIIGKLTGALSSVILIMIAALPAVGLVFVFGGVSFADVIISFVYLIFWSILIGAIGIFTSAWIKSTTKASLLSYGIVLLLTFVNALLVYIFSNVHQIASQYLDSGVGLFSLVLLANPAVSFGFLLCQMTGLYYQSIIVSFRNIGMPDFAIDHFFPLSVCVQSVIIIIMILLAIKCLKSGAGKKLKEKS